MTATICIGGSATIFADDSRNYLNTKQEIINHIVKVNNKMGLIMTEEDIQELDSTINEMCNNESIEIKNNLAKKYLEELLQEAPLSDEISEYSSNDIGHAQLPTSTRGDIFFTDNNMPYNHVGMYISSSSIIESMPKDGVQYWAVSNKESWQSPVKVNGLNNSCILRVSGVTSNQFDNAIAWAKKQQGKSYDVEFLNNKKDTSAENKKFNCSELVWKAYKFNANKDLDSNGGAAVYPNNIKNSNLTKFVKSFG